MEVEVDETAVTFNVGPAQKDIYVVSKLSY